MNPVQHGEVFVTDDGAETDLDLGHYERFIDDPSPEIPTSPTGKIYWSVLQRERRGDYGGGTVQVIPHITDEIKSRFYRGAEDETRIAIIEVGGTVGDIESQPFWRPSGSSSMTWAAKTPSSSMSRCFLISRPPAS